MNLDLGNLSNNIHNSNEMTVGTIKEVDINKIIPYENNPYVIDDEAIDLLAESVLEVGLLEKLVISSEYKLLSGHRRLEALKRAGYDKVEVIIDNEVNENNFELKLIEYNRQRVKTKEDLKQEAIILHQIFNKRKANGEKIPGRINDHISDLLGISSRTVARLLSDEEQKELKTNIYEQEFIKSDYVKKIKVNENTNSLNIKLTDKETLDKILKLIDEII